MLPRSFFLVQWCRSAACLSPVLRSKIASNSAPLAFRSITNTRESSTDATGSNLSPLDGVRVLDLTRIVAGPYCTQILSDLGAEVIKIEKPGSGDEARKWGPPFVGDTNESCYFLCLNRNKKSLCLDLKSQQGRQLLRSLATKSDVLVENYVPGKLDSLGLGYQHLKEVAPHLIYCSITGYGPTGPYKNRPGYDVIAASIGGLLHITGPKDGEPVKVGVAMTDMTTGLYAHGAIMAALIKRGKTGRGQKIDCDLLSTQDQQVPVLKLRLKKPRNDKKVKWTTETVDNEHMNKKKSKCCCIYEKPKVFGESSSSDSSDDECEHCQGHVERKKRHHVMAQPDPPQAQPQTLDPIDGAGPPSQDPVPSGPDPVPSGP